MKRLQFITNASSPEKHLEQITAACNWGVKWVQLRMKLSTEEAIWETARKAVKICKPLGVTLILNDFPEIAADAQCDGVHVGKNDTSPSKARAIIGDKLILGCTANNFEDVEFYSTQKVDYLGLGPFRFTQTKEKLSPVLGIEGYQEILDNVKRKKLELPIYAIGGIVSDDIPELMPTGIRGIAISGGLLKAESPEKEVKKMHTLIDQYKC